jgi:DNA-binding response OmpR family regulator
VAYQSIFRERLFAGQVIVVTGGGSGIGRCTAHELAALGATVALVGRKPERLATVAAEIAWLDSDDMVVHPQRRLTCRVAALTRRARRADLDPLATAAPLAIGSLYLDPARRTVRVRGGDVPVTPHEFRLLHKLASAPGAVFTRERLLAEIWEGEAFVTARSIDTLVYRLRCKIERDPAAPTSIVTVWGEGYKFTNVAP